MSEIRSLEIQSNERWRSIESVHLIGSFDFLPSKFLRLIENKLKIVRLLFILILQNSHLKKKKKNIFEMSARRSFDRESSLR